MDDQLSLSKRIALLKLERKFIREDTYILDSQSTIDFADKVRFVFNKFFLIKKKLKLRLLNYL